MKIIHKQKRLIFSLFILLLTFSFSTVRPASAFEHDGVSTQITLGLAVMVKGQSKQYTVESDSLFNAMIIPVFLLEEPGTLTITVRKTNSVGEVLAVMQQGNGAPESGFNIGVTPRSLSLSLQYWRLGGYTIVYSGLLFSLEEGPFSYTLTLSYS